jgi:hypothetical protein
MKKKKNLEQEINEFLEYWGVDEMHAFFRDLSPLFELYNVSEEDDWVAETVGKENERNVRLIRTVYLISRIAEFHAGRLCGVKMNFKELYYRMEKEGKVEIVG